MSQFVHGGSSGHTAELQTDNQAVGFDLLSGCFGSTINHLILQNIFAHVMEGQQVMGSWLHLTSVP